MIKEFFSYYKPHRKLFAIDLSCSFLYSALALVFPFLVGFTQREYLEKTQNLNMILVMAAILLGVYLLRMVLNYIINYWGHVLGVRIQGDMRSRLFRHLEKLPFTYFDDNKTGWILTRITNDLFEIAELSHHAPEDTFISLVTLVGAIIMMAFFNIYLALVVLVVVVLMLIFAVGRRKKMKAAFQQTREKTGEINAEVESSISGIRVAKAYTAEKREIEKFEKTNIEYKEARKKAYHNMGVFHSGMNFFNNLLYLSTFVTCAAFVIKGWVSTSQFTTCILLIGIMLTPIQALIGVFEQITEGITGFTRYQEILAVPAESEPQNPIEIDVLQGDIVFDNVSFSYKSKESAGGTKVIKNLSLHLPKGKTVALVGPSGGGKTTLCHLIPRFYEIDSGTITIDGQDITQLRRETLRRNVGIVAQDVFLFAGTIKENIAYGSLGATDEEIVEAAKKANIHEMIMSLPLGYDSQTGERGVKLSGGQKQRISIARAFLKNPPILILDEATSSLDNITEMQIQASLEELSRGRTTIVVAHRLSTIKNADEILVLTADGISERGTHDQLMDFGGFYAHLYSQHI